MKFYIYHVYYVINCYTYMEQKEPDAAAGTRRRVCTGIITEETGNSRVFTGNTNDNSLKKSSGNSRVFTGNTKDNI